MADNLTQGQRRNKIHLRWSPSLRKIFLQALRRPYGPFQYLPYKPLLTIAGKRLDTFAGSRHKGGRSRFLVGRSDRYSSRTEGVATFQHGQNSVIFSAPTEAAVN